MTKAIVVGLGLIGEIVINALEDLNYEIIGVDLEDKYSLMNSNKKLVSTLTCDATEENAVKSLMEGVFQEHPSSYLLVNALGVDVKVGNTGTFQPLEKQMSQHFNEALIQGLSSYFLTSKYFVLNHLQNGSDGRILNIASDLSVIAPDHRLYNDNNVINLKPAHYGVVKHGVIGLTKYFSATYAPQIISNSLSPSGIFQDNMDPDFIRKLSERTPLNRLMEGYELAEPIKFLCNRKNSFATGQNLVVDGGRSII